jgi:hypothetical protein
MRVSPLSLRAYWRRAARGERLFVSEGGLLDAPLPGKSAGAFKSLMAQLIGERMISH